MKKIGIITYHFARNYGAVLQCYALQEYLRKKGYYVEIINYVSARQQLNNDVIKKGKGIKSFVANICLLPFFCDIKKKHRRYDSFCRINLNLTPRFESISAMENYINAMGFDYLISGSDQVLNSRIDDFDIAFLYPIQTTAKKIMYAASTGNASSSELQKLLPYINAFEAISIREKHDLVKFNTEFGKEIFVVCDPVELLKAEDWNNLCDNSYTEKYVLCYFLHKEIMSDEIKAAKKIALNLGLKLKVVNARFSRYSVGKNVIRDAGPKEFIELIINADYVCTDSFHGSLFSIIFHKRFTCFDTKKNINDSRRSGLINDLGINGAYRYIEDEVSICDFIDYKRVDDEIERVQLEANSFINCYLNN